MATENKRLAVPASVDSLPTSAMQEDHVSMAWSAARKLRRSVDNLRRVLAVELVCAARAIDLRAPLAPAAGTGAAVAASARAGRRPRTRSVAVARARRRRGSAALWRRARRRRDSDRTARCGVDAQGCYGGRDDCWRSTGACPARHRPHVPRLAAGGRVPHAAEQPRPGGRRTTRRPRRVRRHRPGGAVVGRLRRDVPDAHDPRRRRDDARAVGQAGRRVPHPRVGAARADRQLQPRARSGGTGRSSAGSKRSASRCTAR